MRIYNVDRWKHAQRKKGQYEHHLISFALSGLEYFRVGENELTDPAPLLFILPAGVELEYHYNYQRDNRGILFDSEIVSAGRNGSVHVEIEDHKTEIPMYLQIAPEHVSGWEIEFVRLHDAFSKATPEGFIRCMMGIYDVLRYFLDRKPDTYYSTPAAKLKWLIDDDPKCQNSIEQLSGKCKYCTDHLRTMFKQHYGLSPLQYRNRKRMTHAMELIANSDLTVQEIAAELGFKHNTHFCIQFKSTFNITAGEAIQRFRQFKEEGC